MDYVELGLGVGLVHTICACAEPHKKLVQITMNRYFGHTGVALITRSNTPLNGAHQALIKTLMESPEAVRLTEA